MGACRPRRHTWEDFVVRFASLLFTAGCAVGIAGAAAAETHMIAPGDDVQEKLQEALILAEPGDVIEMAAGHYTLTMGLSLDADDVTLKGAGMDKTVLSFATQDAGAEGLLITSDGCTLEGFAIEDSKGDAIKSKGSDGISFINVRCEWTAGPQATNGAYGLYPVESTNVLIDGCVVKGASDAGIYVGQSKNIILRNSRAELNVAGIEIENCYGADVYDNVATHNTGGILVFDMPGLPQQGGRDVRVFHNEVVANDTKNFAPAGNIVGKVATGTGIMVMANTNVEVFENNIRDNGTFNVLVCSYGVSGNPIKDPNYNQYPSAIYIHSNKIENGGFAPDNESGMMVAALVGTPIPDIVWDGMTNEAWLVDGKLPKDRGIFLKNNGDASFVKLDIATGNHDRDILAYEGEIPPIKPITIAKAK